MGLEPDPECSGAHGGGGGQPNKHQKQEQHDLHLKEREFPPTAVLSLTWIFSFALNKICVQGVIRIMSLRLAVSLW